MIIMPKDVSVEEVSKFVKKCGGVFLGYFRDEEGKLIAAIKLPEGAVHAKVKAPVLDDSKRALMDCLVPMEDLPKAVALFFEGQMPVKKGRGKVTIGRAEVNGTVMEEITTKYGAGVGGGKPVQDWLIFLTARENYENAPRLDL